MEQTSIYAFFLHLTKTLLDIKKGTPLATSVEEQMRPLAAKEDKILPMHLIEQFVHSVDYRIEKQQKTPPLSKEDFQSIINVYFNSIPLDRRKNVIGALLNSYPSSIKDKLMNDFKFKPNESNSRLARRLERAICSLLM